MKKYLKRMICITLSAFMAFATACGDEPEEPKNEEKGVLKDSIPSCKDYAIKIVRGIMRAVLAHLFPTWCKQGWQGMRIVARIWSAEVKK